MTFAESLALVGPRPAVGFLTTLVHQHRSTIHLMEGQPEKSGGGIRFWAYYVFGNAVVLLASATHNLELFRLCLAAFVFITGGLIAGTYARRIPVVGMRVVAILVWELVLLGLVSDVVLRWI